MMAKLARAKAIDQGEDGKDQQQEVRNGPILGNSTTPRHVRHIKSTADYPNPPIVTQKMFNISRCQGCSKGIDKNMEPPNDLVFKIKAIRPYEKDNH